MTDLKQFFNHFSNTDIDNISSQNHPTIGCWSLLKSAYTEKRSGSTIRRRENTLRDIALLELLFATWVRISELCGLSPDSFDLLNHVILIHWKGSKERIIQVENPTTLSALCDYYEKYHEAIQKCNSFSVTQIYTHVSLSKQKEILATKHPRNQFGIWFWWIIVNYRL